MGRLQSQLKQSMYCIAIRTAHYLRFHVMSRVVTIGTNKYFQPMGGFNQSN